MKMAVVFSGIHLGKEPWHPGRDVNIRVIFGGATIDFRQAKMEDVTNLHVTTVFGGAKIIVPEGLPINLGGAAILGGREVKRHGKKPSLDDNRRLNIDGTTIFGGISVTDKP